MEMEEMEMEMEKEKEKTEFCLCDLCEYFCLNFVGEMRTKQRCETRETRSSLFLSLDLQRKA